MSSATAEAPTRAELDLFHEYRELSDGELQAIVENAPSSTAEGVAKQVLGERAKEFGDGKAEELKGEAGESTGKMPPAKPPADQRPEVDEIQVDGSTQLELFDVGGKKPTRATVKFTGGKVKIVSGQAFKKGTRIKFSGEAIVNELTQKDEHDPQTGIVTDCEQRHGARIVDLVVESAE